MKLDIPYMDPMGFVSNMSTPSLLQNIHVQFEIDHLWYGPVCFFEMIPTKNTAGPRKAGHHFRKPAVSGAFVHQVWLQDLLHAPRKPQGHGGNTDDVSKFLLQVPSALT